MKPTRTFIRSYASVVKQLVGHDAADVTQQVKSVPKVSGSGPFVSQPTFQILGHPASIVYMSLPASSTIYTRRGSIVGANGDLNNITSKLALDRPLGQLANSPVLYQTVRSTSPITLLVSSGKQDWTHAILNVSSNSSWTICQRQALLAWTSNINMQPQSLLHRHVLATNTNTGSENGQIALTGQGQVFQLEVESNETIMLNPRHIIAYQTETLKSAFSAAASSPHLVSIPSRTLEIPGLSRWTTQNKTIQRVKTWIHWIATKTFKSDNLVYKIQGPATVIVQTAGTSLNHVITKDAIKTAVKSSST